MRARPFLALALAFVTLATGCLGVPAGEDVSAATDAAALSAPRFDVRPGESVWIDASTDGARLHTRLFLPDVTADPEWKSPVILVMSPYFGYDAREDETNASSRPTYFRYQWLIDHFVPRGYAVAFSDVRGTGDSGGCLEQTAHAQRQDGFDVVEWLGTREWSNGRVGMFGKSYAAETQQGTAILSPPSLKTIVPVASVSGQYEWNYYAGVPFTLHTLIGNAGYLATDGAQPPTTADGLAEYPTRFTCQPEMMAQGADRSGDWNAYWDAREFRPHAQNITASVLYVHGLQDWNVRQVAIRDWFSEIPSEKRALLGQWAHDYPNENNHREAWSRLDWRDIVHQWYDHFLLGKENGVLDALPLVQVQDSAGAWRAEAAFPPADAVPFTLHLAPDGVLAANAPGALDAPFRLRENDEAFLRDFTGVPVPTADSGAYADALAFTSAPLQAPLRFSGWPVLSFEAALVDGLAPDADDGIDAHFAANLFIVHADGEEEWLNSGYVSARHRDGVRHPAPVPEGEVLAYELLFHPADSVVPAGAQVKLVLSGSDRWTEPEGSAWAADVWSGALSFPRIERDLDVVGLSVPLGDPVRE